MAEEVKEEPKVEPPKEAAPPPKIEAPAAEPKAEPTLLGGKQEEPKVSEGDPPKEEPKKDAVEAKDKPPEKPAAPEKYELKLPEGAVLNNARIEKISAFAKEKGLSNEQAQLFLERENDAVTEFVKGQNDHYEKTKAGWKEAALKDAEIAGDETKLKESVMLASAVINRYGSQALRESLDATGLGNHPELLRMVVKIGREMGSDKLKMGGEPPPAKKSVAERLYPTMTQGDSQ